MSFYLFFPIPDETEAIVNVLSWILIPPGLDFECKGTLFFDSHNIFYTKSLKNDGYFDMRQPNWHRSMTWKRRNSVFSFTFSFALSSLIRTSGFAEGTAVRQWKEKSIFLLHCPHLFVPLCPWIIHTDFPQSGNGRAWCSWHGHTPVPTGPTCSMRLTRSMSSWLAR